MTAFQHDPALPCFRKHLFAISSVSGGSLGAVSYAAVQGEKDIDTPLKAVFTTDMLSPTVASLLGPELVQRFLPFALPNYFPGDKTFAGEFATDRGRSLELAFEYAMTKTGSKSLVSAETLLSDYPAPSAEGPPALFLNTTCVETGQRMVISTLRPDADDFHLPLPFETLYDVDPHIDLTLSSAACLSARFPVVSPPAFLPQQRKQSISGLKPGAAKNESDKQAGKTDDALIPALTVKRRYVDGGYCENSGVETALDVIEALQRKPHAAPWRPVLVSVHMDNTNTADQSARGDTPPAPPVDTRLPYVLPPRRGGGFDEILGPASAFFNGWGGPARPILLRARRQLMRSDGTSDFIELNFPQPVILSWYLSDEEYNTVLARAEAQITGKAKAGKGARLHQIIPPP